MSNEPVFVIPPSSFMFGRALQRYILSIVLAFEFHVPPPLVV